MLSIQRFDQATLKKINDDLFYRDIEELKYMDEELRIILLELPGKKKVSYDLKTVICHSGELNEGHYLAYCKRKDDWKCYNDDCVIESEVIEAINEDAYMLVYKVQDN